jgi:O-antigen ligase
MAEKRASTRANYLISRGSFKLPNPGDAFMLVAFGWAAVCFLLVTGGKRFARQVASLGRSDTVTNLVLTEQTAIAAIMLAGIVGIAVLFYVLTRYRWLSIGIFIFSLSFSNALWRPIHDVAFIMKYLTMVYLGAYGVLFFFNNGWKLIDGKGYRLVCLYLFWMGFIALINGLAIGDVWYVGTEFCFMIGFGIAWLHGVNNAKSLERFNMVFAYAAVAVTIGHLVAPLVFPGFTAGGRFVSMFERATGFATIYALYVVVLFWASMYEKNQLWQRIFTVLAFTGLGLILWSGTRNATVAALIGVFGLWWVFRAKIFVYVISAAMVGLLAQILIGGNDNLDMLGDRLGSVTNTRGDIWALYLDLARKSPIFGYGWDGLYPAVLGESLISAIGDYVRIKIPAVHNHYLGYVVRFGVVGLVINLLVFGLPLLRAWRVVFSPKVRIEDKKLYVLPAALLLVVALEGFFEDTMGSTGRGTLHGVILALAVPIVYLYGGKLLAEAEERPANVEPTATPRRPGRALNKGGMQAHVVNRRYRLE